MHISSNPCSRATGHEDSKHSRQSPHQPQTSNNRQATNNTTRNDQTTIQQTTKALPHGSRRAPGQTNEEKVLRSDLTKKLVKLTELFSAGRSWEFVGSCAKAPKAFCGDLKLTKQAGLFIQKLRQGMEDRLLLL